MRRVHPERRLLYVGNWSFYKNVETIALGMAAVQERAPGSVLFLSWPEVLQPRVPAHVVCLGRLSRAEVAEAFELSTVVAMPSLTETIALPLLEALSIGRPIVAADRPYAREVCGPRGALYFDPLDSDSFAAVASRLLQDRDLRSTIADDGRAWAAQAGSDDAYRWMVEAALWGPGCGADQAHA
jgi:glycosyltransferase involved in cell wall biosynthesis